MKKGKKKKEKEISTRQVINNVGYSFVEVFKFNKPYFLASIVLRMILSIYYAFSSTYYIKWVVEAIQNHVDFARIALLVITFVAIMLAENVVEWLFYQYVNDIVHHRFLQNYNKRIFKKAGNVELACYENPDFYNKYTRALDRTPERIMNVFYNSVAAVGDLVRIIFMLSVMISMDKWIALFIILPIIGNFLFGKICNYYEQKVYKESTKANRVIDYVKRVLYLNQYTKEMRITDIYPLIQKKHRQAVDEVCGIYDKYSGRRFVFAWIKSKFTYTLIFEGMVLYCAYKALVSGTMSLSEITVMTSIMGSTAWAVIGIFNNVMTIHNESVYVQNAREFLGYEEKIPEDSDGIDMPESIETVEFRNVCFSYDKKTDNIHNLSMKINAGESVAIAGINGAGKTTLIKLLFRLYDADSGEILLNGVNIKKYNLKQYRMRFAAAFQDYKVVAMSVLDNITMGLKIDNAREIAEDELRSVGLLEKINALPKGIDTVMTKEFDENGAVLSGGQYQKLAVARAFAHSDSMDDSAAVMVFDEPTSALDPIAEYDLFSKILEKSKGKMMIFISHRLSSVKNADKIFMIENGTVIEQGSHAELMRHEDGKYAYMFKKQAENYLART